MNISAGQRAAQYPREFRRHERYRVVVGMNKRLKHAYHQ